jgi:hypothetical protein
LDASDVASDKEFRLKPPENTPSLERELLYGWEVVLFAPHFAIVFGGHLEQFQMAVRRHTPTLIAQPLHFGSVKSLEVNRDPEILIEDLHAIDATNGGCDG